MGDSIDGVPYIAVGANDLSDKLGDTIHCDMCGETHTVEDSKDKEGNIGTLQYVKCGDFTYLVGIKGRKLNGRKKHKDGST